MSTVEYPAIHAEKLTRAAVQEVAHVGQRGSRLFLGLSPFDVPSGATVHVRSDDVCVIRFEYPNSEPPEKEERVASQSGDVSVALGATTRKVLSVSVRHASEVLARGPIPFDPGFAVEWTRGLPSHEVTTCLRNAHLVCAVLQDMPTNFRRTLVKMLQADLATGGK